MKGKVVQWDPSESASGSARFITAGNGEVRVYSWNHSKSGSTVNPVAIASELGQIKAVDYQSDIVAVGLVTGRTTLLRLDATQSTSPREPILAAIRIDVKQPRPVTVVKLAGNLLAVGLEKGRGDSLLVYDVERATNGATNRDSSPARRTAYSLEHDSSTSRHRNSSPAPSSLSPASNDPRPLLQFCASESITSAAFLVNGSSSTAPTLVAGIASKFLRCYDFRSPATPAAAWSSCAVYNISPNPHNGHQFASHASDDDIIHLWDLRRPGNSILSFAACHAHGKGRATREIAEIEWEKTGRGRLATLERDSDCVRVWNLIDGPTVNGEVDGTPVPSHSQRSTTATLENASSRTNLFRLPILLDDQRSRSFVQPLASFAFASSPYQPDSTHFIGISRDYATLGSTEHRIEIIQHKSTKFSAFTESGITLSSSASAPSSSIASTSALRIGTTQFSIPDEADDVVSGDEAEGTFISRPLDRGRSLSVTTAYQRDSTIGSTTRGSTVGANLRRTISRNTEPDLTGAGDESVEGEEGLRGLMNDPSVLVRRRIEKGYASKALLNSKIVERDGSLKEFWLWIHRAELSSKDSCLSDYDFRYRGVLAILSGFPSLSATPSTPLTQTPPSSRPATPRTQKTTHDNRLARRTDETRLQEEAFAEAAGLLVTKRGVDRNFAISSRYSTQRKLALGCCGGDWEDDFQVVCERMVRKEDYENAAKHAFFSGHIERAMHFLRSCQDERLRLLAPVLAAYIVQKDADKGSDGIFSDLCRSLSSDGETPWIRAMFAFLATGDWRELVDETGISLADRIAVALRVLPDSALLPFLQELGSELLASGDLEAVVLFGLREPASLQPLLSFYLDRTADIQTVALATSFVYPHIVSANPMLSRWIETYRQSLDRLQLFFPRALFDHAMGQRSRDAVELAGRLGREAERKRVGREGQRRTEGQFFIRCHFCSVVVSRQSLGSDRVNNKATTSCPSCYKSFPLCAICLMPPSINSAGSPNRQAGSSGESIMSFCVACSHGGHANHFAEWFERSEVCPVADCDCLCASSA